MKDESETVYSFQTFTYFASTMGRAASPALSENEVDISKSLFQDDVLGSDTEDWAQDVAKESMPKSKKRKTEDVVDAFEDDDEDEAFIAATQIGRAHV